MTDCGGSCIYVARKEDPSNWHGEKPDDWVLGREQPVGLKQDTWECPHDALSDREYCAFHTHPENLPAEINESELLIETVNESSANNEEMARRKKEFVGATFGPFDIEGATLDADDDHPIRLDHATFTAGIRADGAVFGQGLFAQAVFFEPSNRGISGETKGLLSFREAKFTGGSDIRFDRTKFSGDSHFWFSYAEFIGSGNVSFNGMEVIGDGDFLFNGTRFTGDGDLSFDSANFTGDGDISFYGAKFIGDGDISFYGTKFTGEGDVSFADIKFIGDGDISFVGAELTGDGNISFNLAEFSGDGFCSFSGTKFNGDGDHSFYGAEFNRDVTFWNAQFNGAGELSLEHAEIGTRCSFNNTQFKQAKRVTFSGADIGELLTFETALEKEEVRQVQERFDFSDAIISGELCFRSSGQSTAHQSAEDRNDEQARFELVFAEAINFSGTTFEQSADFSSTQFRAEADFSGATFEEPANFSSTQFLAEADFRDARVQNTDFQSADLVGPENTSPAAFDKADLSGINFSNANLTGTSFEQAVLNRAELLGADFTRTKLYGALLGDARFNRETKFWLSPDASDRIPDDSLLPVRVLRGVKTNLRRVSRRDGTEPYCVYDPRYRGANGETNLEKAAEVYGTLETLARQQSQPELASDCFLGRKDIQLKQYRKDRNWLMIARSMVPNVVARYGESPLRVLGTAAVTISVCGLAYYSFGLIEHTGTEEPATLFESFYFSALTFTTLGYGDFNPITTGGQVLAVAETSMGVILLAILVFVFGRRATR